ncbi:sodium voltage-gated channel beta subunit 2 [Phyllostomus discolor]|uniref:Sodium channel regulatory subunit beta-2 n=1 Tax=Phyllostomus discolor TaxID=89673 RepID=A0A834E9F5_9CHIR|nr:sodium voltage-gated channel beta subunit 2 [Phyllostomus discolor]
MHKDAWLPRPAFSLTGLSLFLSLVPPGRNMEVTVPTTLNVLNGSDARLACTFNSCYTVNHKQFSLNWTYQECSNCSEEMFLQFRMKIINLKLERFRDRVEFSGNPGKYDVSVTLKNVRIEDEGLYNCYIMNPPDRHRGHGRIHLQVLMEEPPERDSTVAVIVGLSCKMSLLQTAFSNRMTIGLSWEQPRCRDEEGLGATGRELDVQSGGFIWSFCSDFPSYPQQFLADF